MPLLKVLQYPSPKLRRKGIPVQDIKAEEVQQIIEDMLDTLHHTPHCAALAATQLGIENPPCITVIHHPEKTGEILCLINPEIINALGKQTDPEGCVSIFPDIISAQVERAKDIRVKAFDRAGKELVIDASDFLAKVIQHEIDHLHGILFLDHLSKLKRALLEKKMKKVQEQK